MSIMENVLTQRHDTIFVITINRAAVRNAIDGPTADSLVRAFRTFDDDDSLSVAVLTGTGDTFCSGFDLNSIADETHTLDVAEEGDAPLDVSHMLLSKPVIAAVEKYTVTGSLELTLWYDLRVAAEDTMFSI